MSTVEFIWDDANRKHLTRHRITPHEDEKVLQIDPLVQEIQQSTGEDRVLVFGRTANGRLLAIIYAVRKGAIRVVTGYRMTKSQQRIYFEDK